MIIKNKKQLLIFFVVLFFILLVFTTVFFNSQLLAVDSKNINKIKISIPTETSVATIAKILKEKKIIKNEFIFKLYVKYVNHEADLKAGEYKLSKSMNVQDIVNELVKGNAHVVSTRITIPEGFTVEQIADYLSAKGIIDKDKFLQLAKEGNFQYDFLQQIPENKNINYKLEGYLFPDTYEIKNGATEKEIIKMMLSQFQKEWNKDWDGQLTGKKITINQIITIASLIEREVAVDKERPIVAGVIYNRLKHNWPLQIDATIQYIWGKPKTRLTYEDLKIENPYNTYLQFGLPPGPIANPGISSMKAAIFPEENDYYFYVTKKDSSKEHYFSKTFEEHIKNNFKSKK